MYQLISCTTVLREKYSYCLSSPSSTVHFKDEEATNTLGQFLCFLYNLAPEFFLLTVLAVLALRSQILLLYKELLQVQKNQPMRVLL